jgi:hypothetical protein
VTPADPPDIRHPGIGSIGDLMSPTASRAFPDLPLLDEVGQPVGTVPAVALPGARIPAFYAYWLSAARPGALPDVSAIDPLLMPPEILPFMAVYAVEPNGGLRIRLMGTAVADRTGQDLTGRIVEPLGVMATLHARLSWGVKHRRPYVAHGQVPAAERDFIQLTALAAPFADHSGAVQRVVAVLQFMAPH